MLVCLFLLQLLLALVGIYRYDGQAINARLANSEANVLHYAIENKFLNHDEISRIVSTRSKAQRNSWQLSNTTKNDWHFHHYGIELDTSSFTYERKSKHNEVTD